MRLLFEATFRHQEICFYARQVGRNETLGPFCNVEEGPTKHMPGGIEWVWGADRPLRARILLTPVQTRPR